MNGSGFSSGMAGGMAAGYVVGSSSARESERNRQRRKSRQGEDQVLIKVEKPIDEVGSKIADVFIGWFYQDGELKKHPTSKFSISTLILSFFAIGAIIFVAYMVWLMSDYENMDKAFFMSLTDWTILDTVLSAIVSFFLTNQDSSIDYVILTPKEKGTLVLLKKYDSDGYRNLDEDDIYLIMEKLK